MVKVFDDVPRRGLDDSNRFQNLVLPAELVYESLRFCDSQLVGSMAVVRSTPIPLVHVPILCLHGFS